MEQTDNPRQDSHGTEMDSPMCGKSVVVASRLQSTHTLLEWVFWVSSNLLYASNGHKTLTGPFGLVNASLVCYSPVPLLHSGHYGTPEKWYTANSDRWVPIEGMWEAPKALHRKKNSTKRCNGHERAVLSTLDVSKRYEWGKWLSIAPWRTWLNTNHPDFCPQIRRIWFDRKEYTLSSMGRVIRGMCVTRRVERCG